jgi:hypothetical protein
VQTFLVPVKLQNSMCLLKQQNLLDVFKCNLRPCYMSCNISCATTAGATWVLHFVHGLPPLLPIPLPNSFCKACCSLFLCLLLPGPHSSGV